MSLIVEPKFITVAILNASYDCLNNLLTIKSKKHFKYFHIHTVPIFIMATGQLLADSYAQFTGLLGLCTSRFLLGQRVLQINTFSGSLAQGW